ncbi:tetratricopeptide repeat protein [Nannocystis punicea]|uniref:Tetratricopeptide repeat protein n=1 Tax=Nannocystis punicea TaxID=2995304 RepID=A0ABY7H2U4_9BACT|nr:tetratricopeptide repeat protein [Nannocystis poenicansa]WAS93452.1 tetratricopeptide repeat protein [Nannocystis poenicansa]
MRRALLLLALSFAAPGCRGQAAAAPKSVVSAPTPASPSRRAGFVVYTSDDGEVASTIVSFSLGAALQVDRAARLDGLWLLDEGPQRVVVWGRARDDSLTEAEAERLWQARCPPSGRERDPACVWPAEQVVSTLDAEGRVREQTINGASCDCLELPVADLEVLKESSYAEPDDEEPWDEDFIGDPDDPNCRMQGRELGEVTAALLGGAVQEFTVVEEMDCSGAHITDLKLEVAQPVVGGLPKERAFEEDGSMCQSGMPDGVEMLWPPPDELIDQPVAEDAEEAEADEESLMRGCGSFDDEIWSVRRGRLVRSHVGVHTLGSCVCHSWMTVRPDLCRSPADPCGRTSAFPELAKARSEFWVASDERAALVEDDWEVLAAGGRLRAKVEVDATADEIIGVRYHADIEPLLRASATARAAVDEEGDAWPPLQLAAGPAPAPLALAAADVGKTERRGGRDWGNRCFAHFKARRFDAAEAACMKGLEAAQDPEIRAAIFHSLGRVAEARGDASAARIYYRTSLALRDDPDTEKRFERLRR